jgi:hypothetical protein
MAVLDTARKKLNISMLLWMAGPEPGDDKIMTK